VIPTITRALSVLRAVPALPFERKIPLAERAVRPVKVNPIIRLLDATPPGLARRLGSDTLLSRIARPVVNAAVGRRDLVWVTVRSGPAAGLHMLIDPSQEKYYWSGVHELAVQTELTRLLRPGDTFWDVGAHVGLFTLVASRVLGHTGVCRCFEPSPANRARLESILNRNGVAADVHPEAIADRAGPLTLVPHKSSLMGRVTNNPDAVGIAVRATTLDLLAHRLGPPDVVKVDAEGSEVSALRGARWLIARRETTFVVELMDDLACAEAVKLTPGFTFRRITPRHWVISP